MNNRTSISPASFKRYDIWMAHLPTGSNTHVQYGFRPVLVVSNDRANKYSPVVTVIPITSKLNKRQLPTHVFLQDTGLERSGLALCEQILTLDKSCLKRRVGFIYKEFDRLAICHVLAVQLGMAA